MSGFWVLDSRGSMAKETWRAWCWLTVSDRYRSRNRIPANTEYGRLHKQSVLRTLVTEYTAGPPYDKAHSAPDGAHGASFRPRAKLLGAFVLLNAAELRRFLNADAVVK